MRLGLRGMDALVASDFLTNRLIYCEKSDCCRRVHFGAK